MLDSIDEKGKSVVHDPISISWFINAILPKDNRISLFPVPQYGDGFTDLTETYLYDALTRTRQDPANHWLSSLYQRLLGADKDDLMKRRGALLMQLFYTGTGNNYNRQTTFIDTDSEPYASKIVALASQQKGTEAHKAAKHALAESVRSNLLLPSPAEPPTPGAEIVQPQLAGRKKYVLLGSISTDGYQLNVHAIHLGHPRPTRAKADSSSSPAQSSPGPSTTTAAAATLSLPSSSTPSTVLSSSPLPSSKASASWSPSSYRANVEYIHKAIKGPDDARKIFGEQKSWLITSLDPGIRQAASTATIDTLDSEHIRIHDIPSGDLR
ncbi:hypothetical protein DFQ26_001332, partial [Actinomortierella ambigua]